MKNEIVANVEEVFQSKDYIQTTTFFCDNSYGLNSSESTSLLSYDGSRSKEIELENWFNVIGQLGDNLDSGEHSYGCVMDIHNHVAQFITSLNFISDGTNDRDTIDLIEYIKNTVKVNGDLFRSLGHDDLNKSLRSLINLLKYVPAIKDRKGICFYFDNATKNFGFVYKLTNRNKGTLNILVCKDQEIQFSYARRVYGPATFTGVAKFGKNIKNSGQIKLLFNLMGTG